MTCAVFGVPWFAVKNSVRVRRVLSGRRVGWFKPTEDPKSRLAKRVATMKDKIGIEVLKARAIADDYRLVTTPSWLQLDVGNLCNLKCRMCCGYSSSRIDEDLVHRQWNGRAPNEQERLPTGKRWVEDKNFILTELFRHPEQVKQTGIPRRRNIAHQGSPRHLRVSDRSRCCNQHCSYRHDEWDCHQVTRGWAGGEIQATKPKREHRRIRKVL